MTNWQFLDSYFGKRIPNFWILSPQLTHPKDTKEKTLGSFQTKLRTKIEIISQKPSKTEFLAKMAIFWQFLAKNRKFWIFHWNHYSHTLEDTQEKTLGSFHPKLMTKIEVISQKPSKKLDFWQKWPFFDRFWPKNPRFWIFPQVPLLTHARRHTEEDFYLGSF